MQTRPGILARRDNARIMTMDDVRAMQQPNEQTRVQIGACAGCGTVPNGAGACSCDSMGVRGAAAVPWVQMLSMALAPNGYKNREANAALAGELQDRGLANCPAPGTDPAWDYENMDTLYSDPTAVGAGVGTVSNVNVQPEAGCFFAFYWRIAVYDPATGGLSVGWQFRKPRIQGCPIPCDDIDRDVLSAFAPVANPQEDRCCGMKLRAFIQRPSEQLPLVIPIVNGLAAAQEAQVEVRGWCCSTRVC